MPGPASRQDIQSGQRLLNPTGCGQAADFISGETYSKDFLKMENQPEVADRIPFGDGVNIRRRRHNQWVDSEDISNRTCHTGIKHKSPPSHLRWQSNPGSQPGSAAVRDSTW